MYLRERVRAPIRAPNRRPRRARRPRAGTPRPRGPIRSSTRAREHVTARKPDRRRARSRRAPDAEGARHGRGRMRGRRAVGTPAWDRNRLGGHRWRRRGGGTLPREQAAAGFAPVSRRLGWRRRQQTDHAQRAARAGGRRRAREGRRRVREGGRRRCGRRRREDDHRLSAAVHGGVVAWARQCAEPYDERSAIRFCFARVFRRCWLRARCGRCSVRGRALSSSVGGCSGMVWAHGMV